MAERKTPRRDWETALIVGNRIRNRLLRHIMADPHAAENAPPEPDPNADPTAPPKKRKKPDLMTGDQVHAALGLLKKYMPDLKSIEHKGDPTRPVVHEIRRVIIDPANPADGASVPAAPGADEV